MIGMPANLLEQGAPDGLPPPRLCKFVALLKKCAPAQAFTRAAFEEWSRGGASDIDNAKPD
ncbi:MAG: hypothetical protein ABI967_16990 [bacterium]